MSENNRGLRALLTLPNGYISLQRLIGNNKLFGTLVAQYIQPTAGLRILDIGCGTGTLNCFLPPDVAYHGFDINPKYIAYAQRTFAHRPLSRFFCQRVSEHSLADQPQFDVITAIGLLHHLDDEEAAHLFAVAQSHLKPGGRVITLDCCLTPAQNPLAAFLVKQDRGQNVRQPEQYQAVAQRVFPQVAMSIRHDLLHIPYTHTILQIQTADVPANPVPDVLPAGAAPSSSKATSSSPPSDGTPA